MKKIFTILTILIGTQIYAQFSSDRGYGQFSLEQIKQITAILKSKKTIYFLEEDKIYSEQESRKCFNTHFSLQSYKIVYKKDTYGDGYYLDIEGKDIFGYNRSVSIDNVCRIFIEDNTHNRLICIGEKLGIEDIECDILSFSLWEKDMEKAFIYSAIHFDFEEYGVEGFVVNKQHSKMYNIITYRYDSDDYINDKYSLALKDDGGFILTHLASRKGDYGDYHKLKPEDTYSKYDYSDIHKGRMREERYYANGAKKTEKNYSISVGKFNILHGECKEFYQDGAVENLVNYVNGNRQGIMKEYYPDGKIKYDINFTDDKANGEYKDYYESGALKVKVRYVNGRKEGLIVSYYENGKKQWEGSYVQNTLQGQWTEYYEDESLKLTVMFQKGEKNGTEITYYPNGNKKIEAEYTNGDLNGKYEEYFENGDVKSYVTYENGKKNGIESTFYANKQKQSDQIYRSGKLHRSSYFYDEEGNLILSTEYVNGKKEGKEIQYFTNKKKKSESYFRADVLHGTQKEYFENGSIKTQTNYDNGDKNGREIIYHPNGNRKEEFHFKKGILSGKYKEYYQDGNTKVIIDYNKGKKNGAQVIYYPNGNKKEENHFVDDLQQGVCIKYYENGTTKEKANYLKGLLHGQLFKYYITNEGLDYEKVFEHNNLLRTIFYDKKAKCIVVQDKESYVEIFEDELYSGKFEYINESNNTREVRKIKRGLRDGKTIYYDLKTGKKIREEKYEKGQLKV